MSSETQSSMPSPGMQPRAAPDRHSRRERGVTLIEMMVVLVIIAVLAAIVVPNVIGRPDEARVTVAKTDLNSIAGALEMYRLDNRTYPTTRQGLDALVTRPTTPPAPSNWHEGGYLQQLPTDPWGNAYQYRSPGENRRFDLVSYGADGQPGGEDFDADLVHGDIRY